MNVLNVVGAVALAGSAFMWVAGGRSAETAVPMSAEEAVATVPQWGAQMYSLGTEPGFLRSASRAERSLDVRPREASAVSDAGVLGRWGRPPAVAEVPPTQPTLAFTKPHPVTLMLTIFGGVAAVILYRPTRRRGM